MLRDSVSVPAAGHPVPAAGRHGRSTVLSNVCVACSMQFGHRVKSVTLADYKADEVEHMREGGNQVCSGRLLAQCC